MAPKSRKRNAQDAPSASHVPDEIAELTYDAIRFRSLAHQQHFFDWVQNRTPNVEGNPCQLRRHDLKPTARVWLDFVRRSLMPTSNANEVTMERAVLIHSIMDGLSIKAELLISKHISAAAESKDPNKRPPFTGVIYRLLYANGFKKKVQGDELIPIEKPITAESIMKNSQPQFPPQVHHQVHEERDQQEQHFQPPPQQFDYPQPPPQNFPQENNWQELTQ
ncbi:hypothetical protein PIB30_078416 [Stylosanthes scabra]|uniref:Putative plant transposon protein domain-containing protein n=1 Tax=Stylosanthes scabra TaxID=79078 RepID=A0ABU6ZPH5_9FABA|nr:hypothetical protein [Stylosanthes scabra]